MFWGPLFCIRLWIRLQPKNIHLTNDHRWHVFALGDNQVQGKNSLHTWGTTSGPIFSQMHQRHHNHNRTEEKLMRVQLV